MVNVFEVDTAPDKAYFIDTATRDASVEDCIFDLIDNAVDAGVKKKRINITGSDIPDLSGVRIDVVVGVDGVTVEDNGVGIETGLLADGTLRFGRPSDEKYSIGLYGVGLNRAIFKLGNKTLLETETERERAKVEIDMGEYRKPSTGWLVPGRPMMSTGVDGTKVLITEPSSEVAAFLSNDGFVRSLIEEASVRYALFLGKGLEVDINGEAIRPTLVSIRTNGPFKPLTKTYMDALGVSVEISAGQHEDHRFTIEDDYDKKVNTALTQEYGWTVICNDRVIVHADRESKTGWSGFHGEYNGFVGHVRFRAANGRLLPWNTSKSDINLSNAVYQRAIDDMRAFAEEWRSFGREVKKIRKAGGTLPTPPQKKPRATPPAKPKASKPKRKAKGAKKVSKAPVYRTVLPEDIDQRHCQDKLLKVVHEGMQLDMYDNHYSGLALLRILFEQAAAKFLIRHGKFEKMRNDCILSKEASTGKTMSAARKTDFHPDLATLVTWMNSNKTEWDMGVGRLLHSSMSKVVSRKALLNDAIHHPFSQISMQDAISVRDEITPVLRHLIET